MTEPRAREEYGYTSNYQKKSSESKMGSLKNELQNLKLEVNKLMTNKGGIGLSRTPKCTSEQVIYTPSSFEKTLEAKENKDREL